MAAPAAAARGAKRSLEEGVDSKAKRIYTQVGKLHYDLVVQFLKEDNASAADDLIEGLSERAFSILQEFAVGNSRVQDILSRHQATRNDNTEMAEVVVSSFKNLSQMPLDIMLQQANSFLTNKEATFLSQTNKQTMKDLHEGYEMKGMVDAVEYLERDPTKGFSRPPTRFTNVTSVAMIGQLPRETTHIEIDCWCIDGSLMDANFPPHLHSLSLESVKNEHMEGVVLPSSLKRLAFTDVNRYSWFTLKGVNFPPGLEELRTSGEFDQSLEDVTLPSSLKFLSLRGSYTQSLVGVKFPASLETLHLGDSYYESLEGVVFNEGLVTLKIGDAFGSPLRNVRFPASLRVLDVGTGFSDYLFPAIPRHFGTGGPEAYYKMMLKGATFPAGMLLALAGKSIQY